MARTVVGIFNDATEAREAIQQLQEEGISRSNIDLAMPSLSGTSDTLQQNEGWTSNADRSNQNRENNPDFNRSSSSGGTYSSQQNQQWNKETGASRNSNRSQQDEGFFKQIGNFFSSLFDNDNDANRYTQASQNRTVVTVHTTSADEAERAADILDECGAMDVDNQTNYDHATGDMGRGSAFGEGQMQTGGSSSRMSGAYRRSRIFDRPVEAQNRLNSDYRNEDAEDYDNLNQKPII